MSDQIFPDTFLGMRITAITRRRIDNFKRNRRGYISSVFFMVLFFISLFAELIATDKPLMVWFDGAVYSPALFEYTETAFGGEFETEADYRDEFVAELIEEKGWSHVNLLNVTTSSLPQIIKQTEQGVPLWKAFIIFALIALAIETILLRTWKA